MVHWAQPSQTTNRAVTTTILGIAQLLTVLRIYIRGRAKRLWWDDAWAFLTMLLSLVLTIAMWVRTDTSDLGPLHQSHSSHIVAYWLVSIFFTCSLWAARMSLIFSVIRLIPSMLVLRKISEGTAVIFFLMWAGTLAQKTYVAIVELVTDIFADIALTVIPIQLLRGVSLSSDRRRMLYMMFGASLLISMVSIVHAVFLLGPSGLLEAIAAQAEAGTALIVANLGILSPYIYHLVQKGQNFDNKPYTYYHSFANDGEVHLRRLPRADNGVVSSIRFYDSNRVPVESVVSEEGSHTPVSQKKGFMQDFEAQSESLTQNLSIKKSKSPL